MRCAAGQSLGIALALAFLGLHVATASVSRSEQDAALSAIPDMCESKTINYITHTLPQQCLKTAWTSPAPAEATTAKPADSIAATTTKPAQTPEPTPPNSTQQQEKSGSQKQPSDQDDAPAKQEQEQEDAGSQEDLSASTFMSFEEWKEMMLRKSGQDPANIKGRKQHEPRTGERDASMAGSDPDGLGDDGEIALDFDALAEKVSELTTSSSGGEPAPHASGGKEVKDEPILYDDGKTQYYRSKDAGKTCKERFSYSSFDAGATILKTNPGAKNAKAILVENKDSYMLLECRAKNKFVIVELSDDILVDTVVLANFEFFSSMIRKFRVSVSDRFPVKLDKWVDLGTFEARNSRDIQPFLVEHPQIYTKYIRVEFLSHYGNEYYCPVSLLRVHGTRMLDSWKEPDNSQDDDTEQIDGEVAQKEDQPEQTPTPVSVSGNNTVESPHPSPTVTEMGLSPWSPRFQELVWTKTCALRSPTTGEATPVSSGSNGRSFSGSSQYAEAKTSQPSTPAPGQETAKSQVAASSFSSSSVSSVPASTDASTPHAQSTSTPPSSPSSSSAPAAPNISNAASNPGNNQAGSSGSSGHTDSNDTPPSTPSHKTASGSGGSPSATIPRSNKTSSSSNSAPASPTVQESFFKTVTKRLQHLESNTSLSLQYIEEQSRFLQDVLLKLERKQINRVDAFLDTLNKTVLTELRNVRTQYDQIWQSTVIALETQREQSQREIVALSGRLNVLADEVVFQKRMAILQSALLLSCLVLVIFSRGGGGTVVGDFTTQARRHRQQLFSPTTSAADSRYILSASTTGGGGLSAANGGDDSTIISSGALDGERYTPSPQHHHRHHQHASSISRLRGSGSISEDKALPLTPTSKFMSRDGTPTPAIRLDGVDVPFFSDADTETPSPQPTLGLRRTILTDDDDADVSSPDQILTINANGARGGLRRAGDDDDDDHYHHHHQFGSAIMVNQEPAKPPLSRGHSAISQLGGGARKPLPALPEDPS